MGEFKPPSDPFLVDALGASRFVRDLLKRNWKGADFTAAIYWAARCAAHWAMKSQTWRDQHDLEYLRDHLPIQSRVNRPYDSSF